MTGQAPAPGAAAPSGPIGYLPVGPLPLPGADWQTQFNTLMGQLGTGRAATPGATTVAPHQTGFPMPGYLAPTIRRR